VRTPLVERQIPGQARAHGMSEEDVLEQVLLAPQAVKRLIEPSEVARGGRLPRRPVRVGVHGRGGADGPGLERR
jgi:3-hydroxybutyrate dehydrogenase